MKNLLIRMIQSFLKVFYIFPIKKNRVLFSAYSGKNYSCNPKYISEELHRRYGNKTEIIWAFQDPSHYDFLKDQYRIVRFKSLPFLYYILTSRVVVDNVESWSILPKRKGQCVINTWHGGGAYKGVGLQRKDTDAALDQNMLRKHSRVDIYLSSSKAFTEMTLRKSFGFRGRVIECGMPRNDILLYKSDQLISDIKHKLNIAQNSHCVIYAPTFRKDTDYRFELDPVQTINALKKRFGGEWVMLYRAHYYVGDNLFAKEHIMDVTSYDDMQELLLISDVLITDYSSSIWDFSLTQKPAFLYTPDIDHYQNERAFYTPIEEWPYPCASNMDSFLKLIIQYDRESAIEKINKHHNLLGIKESGKASVKVSKIIASMTMQTLK